MSGGGHKKAPSKPIVDTFVKWFFGTFLANTIHFLKKIAMLAIFIGLLGYALGEFKKNGIDVIKMVFHSNYLTPFEINKTNKK